MSANVEGVAWVSNGGSLLMPIQLVQAGVYTILGSNVAGSPFYSMAFQLYNVGGPGTYALGVGSTIRGGGVAISDGSGSWNTKLSGNEGTVVVTALTDTTITGTFGYTATPLTGTATGTKTVTDGEFHLPVRAVGNVGMLPDNQGSQLTATIDDELWNASYAIGSTSISPSLLAIVTSNDARQLIISFTPMPDGVGTFPLSNVEPSRVISVMNLAAPDSNSWNSGSGGSGTITITSFTGTRIRGEFSAQLAPTLFTQTQDTLSITGGTFDLGLVGVARP
jgi:hypothetical protein